ncbi:MAG: diacylglycerol/polyprenol kinase family protein [Promethearchaeota archaeon]
MNQDTKLRSSIMPLWLLSLGIPLIIVLLLTIISTILVQLYKRVLKKDLFDLVDKLELKQKNLSKAKKDALRKLNHLLIFVGLFIVWYIGLEVVQFYTNSSAGMIPEENDMLFLYFQILNEQDSIAKVMYILGWFYYLLFFFFYTILLIMLANEYNRKSHFFSFPFTIFPKLYLTEEEKENYGTYLYFAIGHAFVAFICPPMIFFAILGISSIADLMSSQIGIRHGRHHISWNKEKTWEGTIAGILTTYAICFFFIGHFWSAIFSIAFFTFDIFTKKPINLSDNLLIPIGCGLLYILIRFFFKLDFYTIILAWI